MFRKPLKTLRVTLLILSVSLFCLSSFSPLLSAATASAGTPTPSESWPGLESVGKVLGLVLFAFGAAMFTKARWKKIKQKVYTPDFWRNGYNSENTWIDRLKNGAPGLPRPPTPTPTPDPQLPPPPKRKPLPPPEQNPPKKPDEGLVPKLARLSPLYAMYEAYQASNDDAEEMPNLDILEKWSKKYLDGPITSSEPVPWDEYEYPALPVVPGQMIRDYDNTQWLIKHILDWWNNRGKDGDDDQEENEPPQLPEGMVMTSAMSFFFARPTKTAAKELLGTLTNDYLLAEYTKYLRAAGIRYFAAHEITSHRWRLKWFRPFPKSVLKPASGWDIYGLIKPNNPLIFVLPGHVIPDPREWPDIIPHLRVLDRFRHWLQKPVTAFVGYRESWYNKKLPGANPSFHTMNGAIDFHYANKTKEGEIDASIFYRWVKALYLIPGSGVGAYPTFIHFDTGHGRGTGKWRSKAQRWVHVARRNKHNVFGGLSFCTVGKKKR